MNKTNAMRLLDNAEISYRSKTYEYDENNLGGEQVAAIIGMQEEQVFKTLITKGDKTGINVFCIPVNSELDLKKAATVSLNKKIEMLPMKDLLATTGYIRGGCSPIGMKKKFPTFMDETALLFEEISVSAGIRGCQMILSPQHLIDFTDAIICDIAKFNTGN